MEKLTPELERRLQVEELWARRNVLAESMNASRREQFHAQYSLMARFGTTDLPAIPEHTVEAPALVQEALPAESPRTLHLHVTPPDEPPVRGHRALWSAAAVLAAALLVLTVNLPANDLLSSARNAWAAYQPRLLQLTQPPAPVAAMAVAQTPVAPEHAAPRNPTLPDLRAEVAARIAAAMGSQPHSQDALKELPFDSRER